MTVFSGLDYGDLKWHFLLRNVSDLDLNDCRIVRRELYPLVYLELNQQLKNAKWQHSKIKLLLDLSRMKYLLV